MDQADFSEILAERMEQRGLTVKDVCAATGLSASRLYEFLNGKHMPSAENAVKLAEYFSCSLDFLFGLSEDGGVKAYLRAQTAAEGFREAVDAAKISRYELSRRTGIGEAQLSRWYHGRQMPSLSGLMRISEELNVSLDFLVGRRQVY